MRGDFTVDQWEKAADEAMCLGLQLMKYAAWLRTNQAAFDLIGVRPPELRAVATMVCAHQNEVEAVAAVMGTATDSTGDTLISATTKFGELSVEAYAARWAVA